MRPWNTLLGIRLEELKGQTVGTKLIGEETNLEVCQGAVQAVKANKPYEIEIKIYKKDGSPPGYLFQTARCLMKRAA
jgi:hypothetical protein